MFISYRYFTISLLHSLSQITLQKSAMTGLLFLLAIALNSPAMLFGCIVATVTGLLVAKLCQFDSALIQGGLYGYNAALAGIAVLYFLPLNLASFILVIFSGALSTLLMHLMLTRQVTLSPLTMPFVLCSWVLFALIDVVGLIQLKHTEILIPETFTLLHYFQASMRGVAQVMFQDNWLSGIIFILALSFYSYKVAIWGIFGALLSTLLAVVFGFSTELILLGVYGYNGCLVAIALSGIFPRRYGVIIAAVIATLFIMKIFEAASFPAFTAPFVLVTWLATVIFSYAINIRELIAIRIRK